MGRLRTLHQLRVSPRVQQVQFCVTEHIYEGSDGHRGKLPKASYNKQHLEKIDHESNVMGSLHKGSSDRRFKSR
jgi:hypothetical protein